MKGFKTPMKSAMFKSSSEPWRVLRSINFLSTNRCKLQSSIICTSKQSKKQNECMGSCSFAQSPNCISNCKQVRTPNSQHSTPTQLTGSRSLNLKVYTRNTQTNSNYWCPISRLEGAHVKATPLHFPQRLPAL